MAEYKTADLCDQFDAELQVVEEAFVDFGGNVMFHGQIETIKAFEDNSLVRDFVSQPGKGKVLVVDGGASERRAMLGDMLAEKAVDNGWAGLIINGCIRDSADIGDMEIGVKAIGACPRKTEKKGVGESGIPVRFAGVTFIPGHYVYADEDGIVVSERPLMLPS